MQIFQKVLEHNPFNHVLSLAIPTKIYLHSTKLKCLQYARSIGYVSGRN